MFDIKDYNRKYYIKNKTKILAEGKIWRGKNKKKLKSYFKKDYKINKKIRDDKCTKWRLRNPEKMRARKLWNRYKITIEDYNTLFNKQKGCCAICNRHQSTLNSPLHIDHDHTTNKIRGLLCFNCNNALGSFKESPHLLNKAIDYLKTTSNTSGAKLKRG